MASFGPPPKTIQAKGKGSAGSRGQPKSGGQVRSPSGAKSAPAPRLSDRLNPKTIDPVRCLLLLSNPQKCFHFEVDKLEDMMILALLTLQSSEINIQTMGFMFLEGLGGSLNRWEKFGLSRFCNTPSLVNARVRSTTGGYVFTGVCLGLYSYGINRGTPPPRPRLDEGTHLPPSPPSGIAWRLDRLCRGRYASCGFLQEDSCLQWVRLQPALLIQMSLASNSMDTNVKPTTSSCFFCISLLVVNGTQCSLRTVWIIDKGNSHPQK